MLHLMQISHEAVIEKKRGRGRPPKSADERNESMRRGELVKVAAQLFRQRGFHGTVGSHHIGRIGDGAFFQQLFPEQYFFPLQKVKKSISGVAE